MHGIAASQARNQRAYRKKVEKHVVFEQPPDSTLKSRRSPQSVSMPTRSNGTVLLSLQEKEGPKIVRKNSSPRSGLKPADILIPKADIDFLEHNLRLKRYSWNPPKGQSLSPTLAIPSISINGVSDDNSTDWPNVHTTPRSASTIELASEDDVKVGIMV